MNTSKFANRVGDALLRKQGGERKTWKRVIGVIVVLLLINAAFGWYWSWQPDLFPVEKAPQAVTGQTTTETLIRVAETLLDKPGGYLSNDVLPHSWWLDNMPNWEYGVVIQVRDMAKSMRRDISRSQSQSMADPDLAVAEPQFNFSSDSWAFPSTEGEYEKGIAALKRYNKRLTLPESNDNQAHFYPRADNLNSWLADVQNRLGSLSQMLAASVGRERLDADLRDAATSEERFEQTPWLEIDDRFYRARGACWALTELMRAVEIDFAKVLRKKKAMVSFQQVLRELESTQKPLWSPMVLNGSGFGVLANHSLVLANYISRANAAIIELRQLLERG